MCNARADAVAGLVLLTPVVPAEVGGPAIELLIDHTQPWGRRRSNRHELFFQGLGEQEARGFYALLRPESPRAVYEATRWTVSIGEAPFPCPTLAFGPSWTTCAHRRSCGGSRPADKPTFLV